MVEDNRPRLGRGLAALLGETRLAQGLGEKGLRRISIELIQPNANNPRRHFDEAQLVELAGSIKEKGLIQPIIVRSSETHPGKFELIAGERRWRAAQMAAIHEVPAIVVEATDRDSLELAIVENVQRADLNQIEEARGYNQLIQEFGYTQSDLSKIIGKSRSHLANTIRLLALPPSVLEMVQSGEISAGHARALLALDNPEEVAKKIVAEGLNVREVEQFAKTKSSLDDIATPLRSHHAATDDSDANVKELQQTLSRALGMHVQIHAKGETGDVRIKFTNLDQLDLICNRLKS